MENISDNMQKYENYKEQMGRLNKAIKSGFLLEAIFIEYAVMEDRLESVLKHSGKYNPERHGTINGKLKRIKELSRQKNGLARKYFSEELLDEIGIWKEKRNSLIHALMKRNTSTEELSKIADEGMEIVKKLKSKTSSYHRALEKEKNK